MVIAKIPLLYNNQTVDAGNNFGKFVGMDGWTVAESVVIAVELEAGEATRDRDAMRWWKRACFVGSIFVDRIRPTAVSTVVRFDSVRFGSPTSERA